MDPSLLLPSTDNKTLNYYPQLISQGDTITANKKKEYLSSLSALMLANIWLLLGFSHIKKKKQLWVLLKKATCPNYFQEPLNENGGSDTAIPLLVYLSILHESFTNKLTYLVSCYQKKNLWTFINLRSFSANPVLNWVLMKT